MDSGAGDREKIQEELYGYQRERDRERERERPQEGPYGYQSHPGHGAG